jgi:serine/threonine protein kinase
MCLLLQGIVHRDIKPENLLLDAQNKLKVADLGLAVDTDVGQNTFAGTLSYM